jgi:hypothetical protein
MIFGRMARARDGDPLLLSAGELARILVSLLGDAHALEQLHRQRLRLPLRRAAHPDRREREILQRGEEINRGQTTVSVRRNDAPDRSPGGVLLFFLGRPGGLGLTRRPSIAAISALKRSLPSANPPFTDLRISSTFASSSSEPNRAR